MASVADPLPQNRPPLESRTAQIPWVPIGIVAALLILAYLPVLIPLVNQWQSDEDMGHGFFVPVVAGYIAWLRKDKILATPIKPSYWGLAIIAWGAAQLIVGTLGAELFLQRTSFIITLAGCIVLTCGFRMLRALAFPLVLLLFMVPIPRIVYTRITFPLQLFASRVAEMMLSLIGIPVLRDGNVLELATQKLNVVEACSGIRSLLSLTFLSLVYGFMFDNKSWMRWALFAATIPIAIVANSGRVTITGILSYYKPELAEGFFHTMEGWVIFVVALVLLLACHRLINFVYNLTHDKHDLSPAVS